MKKASLFPILIGTILLLFQACGDQQDCGCVPPPELRSLSAEEELIVASANDFAFDIFSRIDASEEPGKNMFISPLSISTALSMALNGAKGETKEGIRETLRLADMSDSEINSAYKTLVPFLTGLDPKVELSLANSNWYRQDLTIRENLRRVLLEYYNAEIRSADFADPATKNLINAWIEQATKGKIKNMIDQIPPDAVMYLINAIYLKATWQYKFEKNKTEKRDFFLANGSSIKTDMMYSKGVKVNYAANQAFQLIELPYGNGQFVLSVILPWETAKLDEVIAGLNADALQGLLQSSDTVTTEVYLPKFKIEYKITLNDVLAAMGMESSFAQGADFGNLFEDDLDLLISRVLHQSFVEVDEEGTEAAAATVVEIVLTSIGGDSKPRVIYIDRPFAFLIRERHSSTILFAGKLMNPASQ